MLRRTIRLGGSTALALATGLFGLSLLFTSEGEGAFDRRLAVVAAMAAAVGLAVGFVNPRAWLLSGAAAWGAVVLGLLGVVNVESSGSLPRALVVLVLPLAAALLAGRIGAALRARAGTTREPLPVK